MPTDSIRSTRRRRTVHGAQTRQQILQTAADIASAEGLDGLSIGRLASELGMSKSGLFAHFGSKEELQLATIETAKSIFVREVIRPALAAPPGLSRLVALLESWISYGERKVFRGGCFFAAAAAEFDSRPGGVRDSLAASIGKWLATLERMIQEAKDRQELPAHLDGAQLAFELHALLWGAILLSQLQGGQMSDRVRTTVTEILSRAQQQTSA